MSLLVWSVPVRSWVLGRRSGAVLSVLLLGVSLLTVVGGAGPARAASTPPAATSSRYMSTTDPATAYGEGKADGLAGSRGRGVPRSWTSAGQR